MAQIPAGISDREALFQVLARALTFPDYFGHNWDAVDELLRDFSWIDNKRIVIVHHDLPLRFRERDGKTYLEVLAATVKDWKPGERHQLVVVFPVKDRETIQDILRMEDLKHLDPDEEE